MRPYTLLLQAKATHSALLSAVLDELEEKFKTPTLPYLHEIQSASLDMKEKRFRKHFKSFVNPRLKATDMRWNFPKAKLVDTIYKSLSADYDFERGVCFVINKIYNKDNEDRYCYFNSFHLESFITINRLIILNKINIDKLY